VSRENLARDHQSIRVSGIQDLEIYLLGTRMVMVTEVNEHFSFDAKARADQQNPKVQEWEDLMWKYQEPLSGAAKGEKWMLMKKIFELTEY